ncbi:MAG: arginyltransferase [Desulfobulbaceae bacterium]|nr:arginyltransferase [Desulfobulbaceae bacterium]
MTILESAGHAIDGIGENLEQYFVNISTECPYGLATRAVYHQAVFGNLDSGTMACFLENGYRRNGNCMYAMRCPDCRGCVPIRVHPEAFKENRNQRRVWKKNMDVTVGVAPLTMSKENIDLLDRFLQARFPAGKSNAESYYSGFFITSITRCFEIRYRIEHTLLGVAIVDGSANRLNAVYFYFDPDQSRRSPGVLNILYLIHFCRSHKIDPLYLGYWIKDVRAMQYKAAFKPHELFSDDKWQKVDRYVEGRRKKG